MSHSLLAISNASTGHKKVQVNLLPCRVHHDGEIGTVEPYWNPVGINDESRTVYLRGRKLHGKTVKLPAGYYGSVVEKGETKAEVSENNELDRDMEVEELSETIEVAPLDSKAKFDDLVIWGHESTAESGTDPYLRSIDEWVSLSEKLHSYPQSDSQTK